MIGLVIVSHSAKLAEGVCEVAAQMVPNPAFIAVAGGVELPDNPIGTDPLRVLQAIEAVYSDDGVLVLMDLGSAIMSAEAALEFLSPQQQQHIYLCEAPLVEGGLAAAVSAAGGAAIEKVIAEARGTLAAKTAQLLPALRLPPAARPAQDEATAAPPDLASGSQAESSLSLSLIVPNRLGFHARAAARLVELAGHFTATATLTKSEQTANLNSINQVATLGVRQGDLVTFHAIGAQALEVLTAIEGLAAQNFGDDDANVSPSLLPQLEERAVAPHDGSFSNLERGRGGWLTGIPASDGIAIGSVLLYQATLPGVTIRSVEDSATEWRRWQAALQVVLVELEQMRLATAQRLGQAEGAIFAAHALIAGDPTLQADVKARIEAKQINAEAASQDAFSALAERYGQLDDPYLRQRATDVMDVGARLLRHLLQAETISVSFTEPGVLVCRELTPSDAAGLDPALILGIVSEQGGATSHSAILARGLGIPAVVGIDGILGQVAAGQMLALDGALGQIWLNPDTETIHHLQQRRKQWQAQRLVIQTNARQPAQTRDGQRIEVAANLGSAEEIDQALRLGAEGVGLFRTELFFMAHPGIPDEAAQFTVYSAVAAALGDRPLVIRTLDIGGDKPLPYLPMAAEANPFLGWRGIRYTLDNPTIFQTQLRAIVRASVGHNLKLMFPMISTLEELFQARGHLTTVMADLQTAGTPLPNHLEMGIMVETPAAVINAPLLARHVDFFSIGTNDLTQYLLAADRGNSRVTHLVNPLQPAVVRAIQQVVEAGHAVGIWVGICGELAGNPLATPLLVGLGLDELSMSAPAIPAVKAKLQSFDMAQARTIAAQALGLDSASAIEQLLQAV